MEPVIHVPVLLAEVLETLQPGGEARILDLTLGLGGHAEAILAQCGPGARYLGVDRDPEARARAQARLGHDARLTILASAHEDTFDQPGYHAWKTEHAPEGFDIILADLGVSTLQLRTPGRGFSFSQPGPLDMRMDTEDGLTALEWIAQQDDRTLADALYQFGEERASRPIARAILRRLAEGRLVTTTDLAEAIYEVLPKEIAKRKKQIDPATRSFQAIRIAVNGELSRLGATVEAAVTQLKPGGRLGVISFHSLEDRIVKQTLRRLAGQYDGPGRVAPSELPKIVKLIQAGGMTPTPEESQANPPSRSARLRVAERLGGAAWK